MFLILKNFVEGIEHTWNVWNEMFACRWKNVAL